MSNQTSALRFAVLLAAGVSLLLWTSAVHAQTTQFKLTGNSRIQIGNGLPVPITAASPPTGRIAASDGNRALVQQTGTADPRPMALANGQLRAPGNTLNIGVFPENSNVFQVQTRIPIAGGGGTLSAGGRTGPAVYTFTNQPHVDGQMVYQATGNQFGGVAQGSGAGGTAIVAINAGGNNPADCAPTAPCTVLFAQANVADTGAHGGAFGFFNSTQPPIPTPASGGILVTSATPAGVILGYTPISQSGLPNTATSYGGPWTTGTVTITMPTENGAESYVISGSDNRSGGLGSISMVSGTLSNRSLSGPNANRGWLSLNVKQLPEPTAALGAAGALAVLALCHGLVRRRSR